mgnify:CR=1 FL=1
MKNYKEYYRQMGNLLYCMAAADGRIASKEWAELRRIVREELVPTEHRGDEFGSDAALLRKENSVRLLFVNVTIEFFDFIEVDLDFGHLRLQLAAVFSQDEQELFQLRHGVARAVVHVDEIARLGQGQAQAFGAQGQAQTGAVAVGVGAVATARPRARRLQQAQIFVKAHGTGGEVELFGQVADRKLRCHVGSTMGSPEGLNFSLRTGDRQGLTVRLTMPQL